jgi:glycosyltransferase involved in cell wall biosynthesis
MRPLTIFFWHVHGSWTTSFVQGPHRYLVATLPDRGADGLGRARTWCWPDTVVEVGPADAAAASIDVVVLQRPLDLELAPTWLGGRRPGRDVGAVYVEHNAPQGRINELRHPLADRSDIELVHVTHFNDLFWDSGRAPHRIVEHGVVDPGHRFTGELPRAVAAINEARRRGRVTGTDLLGPLAEAAPIDLFGMDAPALGGEDLPQAALHREMARRRAYVHPFRWTSLGLTLIEAMLLGLPIVALATTETSEAVPAGAGVVSNRMAVLQDAIRTYVGDPDAARAAGLVGRASALTRYSLDRFVADWDGILRDAVERLCTR